MKTQSRVTLGRILLLASVLPFLVGGAQIERNLKSHRVVIDLDEKLMNEVPSEELDDDDQYEILPPMREETPSQSHPCQRPCEEGQPMTCKYNFTVEYYYTMSKACYNCPYNITDCYLNHCIPGDGVERTILVVNRRLPGPSIDVCFGDTVEVELKNQMLDVSTTIHWHGVFQKETPFMDGVPFVSQCLVAPKEKFLYRFYADNPGTHLWHSHSALQRGDGIFGPLIIRLPPSQEPHLHMYDYDLPEHVTTILDWNHRLSVSKFMSHYHSRGSNKPASILVNGKGRYREFTKDGEIIFTPSEKFTVVSGNRYRFRVINAGFLNCPIEITVDNHNITVIASDGGNLEPIETQTLVSVAGETFDFVLEANQPIGNYWIRFAGQLDCRAHKAFQVAILHYEGADDGEDPELDATYDTSINLGFKINAVNTKAGTDNMLLMSELASIAGKEDDPALKPEPDLKFYVAYDFYPVENVHFRYPSYNNNDFNDALIKPKSRTPQFNHISMKFPNFALMADLEKANNLEFCNISSISMDCRFEFCECPHILEIPLNAVVEFILIDEGVPFEANHPIHLHGYNFRLIGMDRLGTSTSEEEVRKLDEQGLLKRNLQNPPRKDTITIPDGGYAIVRFHATNPGFWILHCHLDFHVEMGMAFLIKVGNDSDFVPPPKDFPSCGDPFLPVPVNQTNSFKARVYPVKGIFSNKARYLLSVDKASNPGLSLVLLLFCLHFPVVVVYVLPR